MIRLAVYLSLLPARFGHAFRRHWRRIMVGAALGWAASTSLGALALALLEMGGYLSPAASPFVAGVVGWSGIALGAGGAYALR